jgi:hypothetical protein
VAQALCRKVPQTDIAIFGKEHFPGDAVRCKTGAICLLKMHLICFRGLKASKKLQLLSVWSTFDQI